MRLCVNGLSALRVLRILRGRGVDVAALPRRDVVAPKPEPGRRWTKGLVGQGPLAAIDPGWQRVGLNVAVPSRETRLQAGFSKSTVHGSLPHGAFLDVGDGLLCAGPELLFFEMGRAMRSEARVLFGYELCGSFSRDADDPHTGDVRDHLRPATSVGRIASFLDGCGSLRGLDLARDALGSVADNAWSPMEALLACLLSLPVPCYGYGLGPVVLNPRQDLPRDSAALGARASRVPDIVFEGTPVGLNYDGRGHLDLSGVEDAAASCDGAALARAERAVRGKVLDDLRRDRELAACGLVVLPVTSEDVVARGGLDAVVSLAMHALERFSDRDMALAYRALEMKTVVRTRQKIIWSFFPWEHAAEYARQMTAEEREALTKAHIETATITW